MNKRLLVKVLRKSGLFKHINITALTRIGSKWFKIPIIREIGLGNLLTTEPWMMELIKEILKEKNGCFLDVGANIGQTLLKLKSVAPEITYLGIEPNPACVFYLRELIKINHLDHCMVLPIGLYYKDTLQELQFMGKSQENSGASIIPDFRPNNQIYDRQFVPVFKFDNIGEIMKGDQVAIIKIDVEGAELEVLQGLQNALSLFHPFLILEILPVYNAKNSMRLERQQKIELFANDLGYKIYRIGKTSDEHFAGLEQLETIGIHADLKQCDYLLTDRSLSIGVEA